jgi:hypothetical protein
MPYLFLVVLLASAIWQAGLQQWSATQSDLSQIAASLLSELATYDRLTPAHVIALTLFCLMAFTIRQRGVAFLAYGIVVAVLAIVGYSEIATLVGASPPFTQAWRAVTDFVGLTSPSGPNAPPTVSLDNGLSIVASPIQIIIAAALLFVVFRLRRRLAIPAAIVISALVIAGLGVTLYHSLAAIQAAQQSQARAESACLTRFAGDPNAAVPPQCLATVCKAYQTAKEKGGTNLDLSVFSTRNPQTRALQPIPIHLITALCSAQHT